MNVRSVRLQNMAIIVIIDFGCLNVIVMNENIMAGRSKFVPFSFPRIIYVVKGFTSNCVWQSGVRTWANWIDMQTVVGNPFTFIVRWTFNGAWWTCKYMLFMYSLLICHICVIFIPRFPSSNIFIDNDWQNQFYAAEKKQQNKGVFFFHFDFLQKLRVSFEYISKSQVSIEVCGRMPTQNLVLIIDHWSYRKEKWDKMPTMTATTINQSCQ